MILSSLLSRGSYSMSISPSYALLTGIALSFFLTPRNTLDQVKIHAKKWSSKLLQFSIILLGPSLEFNQVLKQGATGSLITFLGLLGVFTVGFIGIKVFKIDHKLGLLITMGTAICGGSAIGALSPIIAADATIISLSILIVFILNGVAIFLFPFLGDLLHLSQESFGTWAALAIHDTSSVVAASSIYGNEALAVATTLKLTRALWIIPVTVIFSLFQKKQKKISIPWFVAGFLIMSFVFSFFPFLTSYKQLFIPLSKLGMAISLFLIGLSFDFLKVRTMGWRPLMYGVSLWIMVIIGSLLYVH